VKIRPEQGIHFPAEINLFNTAQVAKKGETSVRVMPEPWDTSMNGRATSKQVQQQPATSTDPAATAMER
jgi:hypothetical protein